MKTDLNIAQRICQGARDLTAHYDVFVLDLWGVVHNGREVYDGVDDCLGRLRAANKKVVMLSNAPRPGDVVAGELSKYGVDEAHYDVVITSGDATIAALNGRTDAWHRQLGRGYYHIGPPRSAILADRLHDRACSLAEADYLLVTGPENDETEQAEDYRDLFATAIAQDMPMICANPDIVVMRGEQIIPCAGALAVLFEQMGGEVMRYGKPYEGVFATVFAHCKEISKQRFVMIGDTFHTDIAGARGAGMDSVWVAGGIAAEKVGYRPGVALSVEKIAEEIRLSGENPNWVLGRLNW